MNINPKDAADEAISLDIVVVVVVMSERRVVMTDNVEGITSYISSMIGLNIQ